MMAAGRPIRSCAMMLFPCALLMAPGQSFATPTGLNNIPTADVVPPQVLVLQGFFRFGEERQPAWFAGFKYGPAENWEVGLDDTMGGPGSAGGPTLQAKHRVRLSNCSAMALGAANISSDRSRHGNVFPYAVLSAKAKRTSMHLGRSWEDDNNAWFVGVDGPVIPGLTLRADWIQASDGDESVASVGFIAPLGPRWLVEGWVSFPTAEGTKTDYVLKLDWVVPFDTL